VASADRGSGCKFLYMRDEKKSGSPALAPWAHISEKLDRAKNRPTELPNVLS